MKKSRVVIVGDVGLNINRNDILRKKLIFLYRHHTAQEDMIHFMKRRV